MHICHTAAASCGNYVSEFILHIRRKHDKENYPYCFDFNCSWHELNLQNINDIIYLVDFVTSSLVSGAHSQIENWPLTKVDIIYEDFFILYFTDTFLQLRLSPLQYNQITDTNFRRHS